MAKRTINPETQLNRALRLLGRGQFKRGLRQLEHLLPQVQDNPVLAERVCLGMADAYLSLRELPAAVNHAKMALEFNPENAYAYYLLGFAHSIDNAWDQAVSALHEAAILAPDEPEYARALGWALFNQDETDPAGLTMLEKTLQMAPTHIPTLTDLAMAHNQVQDFDQALIYARRAVGLAPSDPKAREVLDRIKYFKAQFERFGVESTSKTSKPSQNPSTEAEWRELIAKTDDYNDLVQFWIDLHPADDMDDLNAGLQELQELWNTTPRPELGGRSPNEMMGR